MFLIYWNQRVGGQNIDVAQVIGKIFKNKDLTFFPSRLDFLEDDTLRPPPIRELVSHGIGVRSVTELTGDL